MSIIEKVLDKLEKDEPAKRNNKDSKSDKNTSSLLVQAEQLDKDEMASSTNNPVGKQNAVAPDIIKFDYERLKNLGILTPDTINITLSEQFRRIKMPILANAYGNSMLETDSRNMIMVTSSLQNEGKSFTSFNLAMSIAKEFNHTVLYIDADITQRTLENLLGVSARPGLVDYLLDGDRDLARLLLKTDVPRLTLLPSGRAYDRVTELWSSQRMNALMDELSSRYHDRVIIFDAPPLLQDSSASILARLVGQVIIVVEAEKTPKHVVEEAVSTLDGTQYVGLILNKSNQRATSDYDYYYTSK